MTNIRYALRRLATDRGHTALMVLTIALGIGATTAVFSVVDQTVLRPAPYAYASRLVDVLEDGGNNLTPPKIAGWQQQRAVFERFEGYSPRAFDVTGTDEPERISGLVVSTGLLDMLGVQPQLGRGFRGDEGRPGSERVVIVSDALWRRRLGAGADALGRRILLNGDDYTVIGVMANFHLLFDQEAFWIPLDMKVAAPEDAALGQFYGLGRLASGVTPAAAPALVDAEAERLQRDSPLPRGWHLRLTPKRVARVNETTRTVMFVLLGAVAFVLLIACANVANLFLSKAALRQREMAIRSALGASRIRLVADVLLESVLLAGLGGVLGVLLAMWGVGAIVAAAPVNLASMATTDIHVDGRIVAVAAALTLVSGLLFGLVPALRGSRPNLERSLRQSAGAVTSDASFGRVPSALVIAEVAFSVVLLVGATLMMRTLVKLEAIDPGFDPRHVIAFHVDLPTDRYPTNAERVAFFDRLIPRLHAVAGLTDAAVSMGVPPTLGGFTTGVPEVDGAPAGTLRVTIPNTYASPEYFRALRIPILQGRAFKDRDGDDLAIVSKGLADRFWPDANPIGRRFRPNASSKWLTVVGVAGTVETRVALETRTDLQLYYSWGTPAAAPATPAPVSPARRSYAFRLVVVRADDPARALAAIKAQVWALDPNQPVDRILLVEDAFARAFGRERFVLMLMAAFAIVSLALAAAGLFAVLSHAVAQRTREIGIRVALGARPADVFRLIVARGMLLAAVGSLAGVGGAAALSGVLRAVLFDVSPWDPLSFAIVVAVLDGAALIACWAPTRRAMRIEPAVSLRME